MHRIQDNISENFFGVTTHNILQVLKMGGKCTIYGICIEDAEWLRDYILKTLQKDIKITEQYSVSIKSLKDYSKGNKNVSFFTPSLNHTEIERLIKLNNSHFNAQIPLPASKKILFLSGGNITLFNTICREISERGKEIIDNKKQLLSLRSIQKVLEEIAEVMIHQPFDILLQTGIINSNGTGFSPLLKKYLLKYELSYLRSLFPKLTDTDIKILSLFIQNPEKPIDKEQIGLFLGQPLNGEADWAIYKAVERLKPKIKGTFTIKTVKGKGWMLNHK